MRMKACPRYAELKGWLKVRLADARPFGQVCYRVAGPRYTTADEIVSGVGGRKGGGRWNPAGVMNAVYLSTDPSTAMDEALQHHRYFGLSFAEAMPKVTVGVEVVAEAVLDLTIPGSRLSWPVPMTALLAEDWRAAKAARREAVTQAVGRAAFTIGLGGLVVPSQVRAGGVNVVIFPDRLSPADRLVVREPDLLAKLGRPA